MSEETCVMCGNIVPQGKQYCYACQKKTYYQMELTNKVLRGLACHNASEACCEYCPYYSINSGCVTQLVKDTQVVLVSNMKE